MQKHPKGTVSAKRSEDAKASAVSPAGEAPESGLVPAGERLPQHLPLLPVSQTTLFPGMIVPFILPEGKLIRTIDSALEKAGYVGVVLSRSPSERAIAAGPSPSFMGLPADGTVISTANGLEDALSVTEEDA